MRETLVIKAAEVGWSLETGVSQALMFLSGAAAERTARTIAQRISEAGIDVSISVTDRAGELVSVIHYYAATLI
jgi:hypothetical protein